MRLSLREWMRAVPAVTMAPEFRQATGIIAKSYFWHGLGVSVLWIFLPLNTAILVWLLGCLASWDALARMKVIQPRRR
jgi:hypothetical protein